MSDVDDVGNGTTIYEVWEMSDVDDGGDGTTIYEVWVSQCGGPKKETNHTSFFQLKRTAVTPFTQSKRAHKCITFQQ
jgi:hypothetical protein